MYYKKQEGGNLLIVIGGIPSEDGWTFYDENDQAGDTIETINENET